MVNGQDIYLGIIYLATKLRNVQVKEIGCKQEVLMEFNFDNKSYSQLLAETVPQVIESEEEYSRLLKIAEFLVFKKDLNDNQRKLEKLIGFLIEDHESNKYKIDESAPHEVLQHIMESSGLKQSDLAKIINASSGVMSEILSGKRTISKAQAKALATHFKISADLFI